MMDTKNESDEDLKPMTSNPGYVIMFIIFGMILVVILGWIIRPLI